MKLRTKILFTIAAAVCFWSVGQAVGCYGTIAEKKADYAPDEKKLQSMYLYYNEHLFYGGLPVRNTVVRFGNLSANMGMTIHAGDRWEIIIDPKFHATEKQAEFTEVHEMCHQESEYGNQSEGVDGHGDAFEACMVSIAKRGGFKDLW